MEQIKLWYMRDNHTFRNLCGAQELPLTLDEALTILEQEFDAGYKYGMLCSKDIALTIHCNGDFEAFSSTVRSSWYVVESALNDSTVQNSLKEHSALELLKEVAELKRHQISDARRTTTDKFVKAGTLHHHEADHSVVNVPDELLARIDLFLHRHEVFLYQGDPQC